MKDSFKVVVDADAIIALTNSNDAHHKKAHRIATKLIDNNADIIYPSTAIAEANAFIQRPLSNSQAAYESAVLFTHPHVHVAEVSQQTIRKALSYFGPSTSKKNTLFDCIVAAIAKEEKADAVFSFDSFYTKCGFKLASKLL